MQHFKSIILSFLLLMFCWQSSIAQSDELEYIFTDMQQAFPDCLANYTVNDFADTYELIVFMEEECNIAINDFFPTDGDDWNGGNDWSGEDDDPSVDDGNEWTVADEWGILAEEFPWCFENTQPGMFDSFDALYYYLETTCFNDSTDVAVDDLPWDDWGGEDDDPSVDDGNEWTVADEWGILAEEFPWCFENTQPGMFDSFDALYYYFETTCFNDSIDIAVDDLPWDDWGGNDDDPSVDDGMFDDNGEWTVADEWAILAEEFPWCFENTQPGMFDSFDALYYYFETTCFNDSTDVAVDDLPWDDWGGNDDDGELDDGMVDDGSDDEGIEGTTEEDTDEWDEGNDSNDWGEDDNWNWTVEDELMWLQQEFPECLANVTANMFDGFEALYDYVDENCFDDEPIDPWVPELPECVFNIVFDENTGLQDFIINLVDECGDIIDLPACFIDAPAFDTDEAFIQYLFENCDMFDGFGLSNPNDGMTTWDNAAQWYNLAPIINGSTTAITTVNSLDITTYPNPTDTYLNIEIETTNLYTLELYDISGKLIYTSVARGNNTIDVSQFNTGIYLLNITSGNSHYSSKMHIK